MISKKKATSPQSKKSGIETGKTSKALVIGTQDTGALETAWQARLTPIIERLRTSWLRYGEEEEVQGMKAGRVWAEETAESIELQRLADANDLWWALNCRIDSPYTQAEQLFFVIRPDMDGDRRAAVDFWSSITGKRANPELIFVRSFAERAMEVWDQVEDQI